MPMGIVSDDDFNVERAKLKLPLIEPTSPPIIPVKESHVIDINRGRGTGTKEVPQEIRELTAMSAINGEGTAHDIAQAYGVSESSVSAYKVGATSTASYSNPDQQLLDKVLGHKERISRKARSRLVAALNHITPDKLAGVKAVDLANIAKSMSSIVADMEPPKSISPTEQNNVQFVFMAPRVKPIQDYNIIEVNE